MSGSLPNPNSLPNRKCGAEQIVDHVISASAIDRALQRVQGLTALDYKS